MAGWRSINAAAVLGSSARFGPVADTTGLSHSQRSFWPELRSKHRPLRGRQRAGGLREDFADEHDGDAGRAMTVRDPRGLGIDPGLRSRLVRPILGWRR